MKKFVTKNYLYQASGSAKSSSELVKLDVYNRNHQKSLRLIEIRTKAKVLLSGNLVRGEKQDLFRKECQLFYSKVVMYLQQNLPFDVTILKYAQFLHPEKRNNPGSTSGISNLALKVAKALENDLQNVSGPSVRQPRTSLRQNQNSVDSQSTGGYTKRVLHKV